MAGGHRSQVDGRSIQETAETLVGISVVPGYAAGEALVYDTAPAPEIDRVPIERHQVAEELERFDAALRTSTQALEHLRDRVLADLGPAESEIFSAHLSLLADEVFVQGVKRRIADGLVRADSAVEAELERLRELLENTDSAYLSERTQDIDDLGRRLFKSLGRTGGEEKDVLSSLPPHTIVVAHQLFPSDTLHLDAAHVAGIVTEGGGAQSHAAILARSLGIPAVTGVRGITERVRTGDRLLIDATAGTVTLTPSKVASNAFSRDRQRYERAVLDARRGDTELCRLRCGTTVELLANIGRAEEAEQVTDCGLGGVGLFRTEYLFLNASHPPGLDQQATAYRKALRALHGRPLTLRTVDFGADKHPMFLEWTVAGNPNLGLRGLRFALEQRELLETQLRAALRVARHGTLRIMFPMVIDVDDLAQAVAGVRRIAGEEGAAVPDLGAMIETPAAIFQLDHILEHVDFVSIGTNDLTQFILAADRDSAQMMAQYSALHPAVLRAVAHVVEAAASKGRPCSICGEAAGDPRAACLFIGLGVRRLSMSPVLAPAVRQKMNRQLLSDLERAAHEALSATGAGHIETVLAGLP